MVESTMMDHPLTLTNILQHGYRVHSESEVVTFQGEQGVRRVTFADTYQRMEQLAKGLQSLGVDRGDVVGTFMFNNQEHLEAYFAVPCMGAVLHMLNIRLFDDQLAYVLEDGGAKVIIIETMLLEKLAQVADEMPKVEHLIVVGDPGDAEQLGFDCEIHRYDELIGEQTPGFEWPDIDEHQASSICHTSGTTGNPKGVVYSHRSNWTHTFGASVAGLNVDDSDRMLLVVPQFHANAWGLIYLGWMKGSDILQPGPYLQPEPLVKFIEAAKPTCSAAVPTVWNGVLAYGDGDDIDLSSMDWVVVGGAAVPRSMIEAYKSKYDIDIVQGWGMTEMSPLGGTSTPPAGVPEDEEIDWRAKTCRIAPGVEMRIVDDEGDEQPWDGKAQGEVQVRGPWITGEYLGIGARDKFTVDGWLRTGDVATIDPKGFMNIVDRTKDVIKSGGEWISSVDLENEIMAHDGVLEAAVIGVPDEEWDERPLACVVRDEGSDVGPEELQSFLEDRVASWWIPERWAFIDEVPKTSVGKFDKKVLRERQEDGELDVSYVDR